MDVDKHRIRDYIVAILIRIPLVLLFAHDWDMFVFTTVAKLFVLEGISPYDPVMDEKLISYIPYYPTQFNWYAYPPLPLFIFSVGYILYLLFAYIGVRGQLFERFFVGMSISCGDILLAYYAYKILEVHSGRRSGRVLERAILYNPFIIFISSLWGMMDSWSVAFLFGSIYYLMQKKYDKSAVFYALSVLTKQLTLFYGPLFLACIMKKSNIKNMFRFAFVSVLLFASVSLPFIIINPSGFFYKTFLFHIGRYPQGLSVSGEIFVLLSSLVYAANLEGSGITIKLLSDIVTLVSFSIMLALIVYVSLKYLSQETSRDIEMFIQSMFMITIVVLFLNKVSNPQYFVLLVSIGLMYSRITANIEATGKIKTLSNTLIVASILLTIGGTCFFSSAQYLKLRPIIILWEMYIRRDPVLITPTYALLFALAFLVILKIDWLMLSILVTEFTGFKHDLGIISLSPRSLTRKIRAYARRIIWTIESSPRISIGIILLISSSTVISALVGYNESFSGQNITENIVEINSYEKIVGVFYRWIVNPAHDTNISAGYWSNAKLTPLDGYYDSSSARLIKDINMMKEVGIETIIFDVFTMGGLLMSQIMDIVSEENISSLIYFNFSSILEDPLLLPFLYFSEQNVSGLFFEFSPRNIMLIKNQVWGVLNDLQDSTSLLRYRNRTIILVDGIQRFLPGWGEESKRYLAAALIEMIELDYNVDNITMTMEIIKNITSWNISTIDDLIYYYYPQDLYDFVYNESCEMWFEAFKFAWLRDMSEIFRNITIDLHVIAGYEILPISIVDLDMIKKFADDVFMCPNKYAITDDLSYLEHQREMLDRFNSSVLVAIPNFISNSTKILINSSEMYNETWRLAISENVSYVFIYGWNMYETGSVIEPTVEFGSYILNITEDNIKAYLETRKSFGKKNMAQYSSDTYSKTRYAEKYIRLINVKSMVRIMENGEKILIRIV